MNKIDKNKKIANTMKETYVKRKSQICKCFKFKIDKSNLSKDQANRLKMLFVEAKWIYNYILANYGIDTDYKTLKTVTHKDKDNNDIVSEIIHLGAAVK